MPDSIHVARWILQIQQPDWEMHLFPSIDYGLINPELKNVTVHHSIYAPQPEVDPSITTKGIAIKWPLLGHRYYTYRQHLAYLSRLYLQGTHPHYRARTLARLIQKLKPDIIHSMEFQHGGYLTLEARDIVGGGNFPKWIATNWGNDIYLYGQLKDHQPKIKKLLVNCDYCCLSCLILAVLIWNMYTHCVSRVLFRNGALSWSRGIRILQGGHCSHSKRWRCARI